MNILPGQKQIVETEKYKYILLNTGRGSDELGNCEVCRLPVTEIFIQSEQRKYLDKRLAKFSWTSSNCRPTSFGHRFCLEGLRKK